MNLIHMLFDVNAVAFTVLGYPLSYLELFGTIFNLWSVWLVARGSIWNWPVGIIGVILFFYLFYQIRLYSDTLEQVYFFITSFYGWWVWIRQGRSIKIDSTRSRYLSYEASMIIGAVTVLLTFVLAYIISHLNVWLPVLFPESATYVFLDAFTTIMSFVAMILMAQRFVDCWYYWILVDVLDLYVYYQKDVKFILVLYAIFLVLAIRGLLKWQREASWKHNYAQSMV